MSIFLMKLLEFPFCSSVPSVLFQRYSSRAKKEELRRRFFCLQGNLKSRPSTALPRDSIETVTT